MQVIKVPFIYNMPFDIKFLSPFCFLLSGT